MTRRYRCLVMLGALLFCVGAITACTQSRGVSTTAPAIVGNIEPNEIQTVSIDGWGPGAAGDSITFLYNPFGKTQAIALMKALQQGKTVSNNHLAHDTAVGGQAWLVFHLDNGRSLKIEWAGYTSATGIRAARNTVWVSLANQSNGTFIETQTGALARLYMGLFHGAYDTLRSKPAWLNKLSSEDVQGIAVDGNNKDTWFQDHSLPYTAITPSNIMSALKSAPSVDLKAVDFSKIFRPGSRWRTNSISMMLQLTDGSTVHVSGPYGMLRNADMGFNGNVFKLTYASLGSMNSWFIKDSTGQITKYWDQLSLNE